MLAGSEPNVATALSRVELAEGVSPLAAASAGSSRSSSGQQSMAKYIKDITTQSQQAELDEMLMELIIHAALAFAIMDGHVLQSLCQHPPPLVQNPMPPDH